MSVMYTETNIWAISDEERDLSALTWRPIRTVPIKKKVMITFLDKHEKRRVTLAEYVPRYSLLYRGYEEFGGCDEKHGKYYSPAGWYEIIEMPMEDNLGLIYMDCIPTHWMPLPKLPKDEKR